MDTITAIKTRRSVRNFTDQQIPDDILQEILEAGRFSPSPLNSQPWHFIIVKNKDTISSLMPKAQHGSFLTQANVVVVVTVDRQAKVDTWLSEHEQHVYSGACAIQNMWLAAWSLDVGGCWVTVDEKTTRGILSIPDNQIIIGSLALGFPKEKPTPHTVEDRKPLEQMVFYETFGNNKK